MGYFQTATWTRMKKLQLGISLYSVEDDGWTAADLGLRW